MSNQIAKGGWVEIGGKRFYTRSLAEKRFAQYLQFLKDKKSISDYHYEPKTFWFEGIKRGCVSYKPDFLIEEIDGSHWWGEVKGYMDPKSATKIKRFQKYFPEEKIRVIDSKWISTNSNKLKGLIKWS
jgi:hypothetical protein